VDIGSDLDPSVKVLAEKRCGKPDVANLGTVGFSCRKGLKSSRMPNQDSWAVRAAPGAYSAVGVFDGHGKDGHVVSYAAKGMLMNSVPQAVIAAGSDRQVQERVQSCFHQAHRLAGTRKESLHSGTTATVVVHDTARERVVVSHVGDSKAVLLRREGNSSVLTAKELTEDHRPQDPGERRRIEKQGGKVVCISGHHRVKTRQGVVGLNMSRTIGDCDAHGSGVSAHPDVSMHDLDPEEDVAVLVASDGVWEVISPREAAEIVSAFPRHEAMAAAQCLADKAITIWLRETGGVVVDDVTAVLAWPFDRAPGIERSETGSTTSPPSSSRMSERSVSLTDTVP